MTIIELMAYIAVIIAVVFIVFAVALARTRRDLAQMSNDLARLASAQKQPAPEPTGHELVKVRENIEQLLDVLEERSATAERQLRQLIEEAKDAAKQIDEATAVAVRALDSAAQPSAKGTPASTEPVEEKQSAPQALTEVPQTVPPPEPPPVVQQAPVANGSGRVPDRPEGEEALLEPLTPPSSAPAPAPVQLVVEEPLADEPPVRVREEPAHDPLSAWAPYRPAKRVEETTSFADAVEASVNGRLEADKAAEVLEPEAQESHAELEDAPEEAEEDAEAPDFQPFAIKPASEPAKQSDEDEIEEAPGPAGHVIDPSPVPAHIYASEMKHDINGAHLNGQALEEDAPFPSAPGEDVLSGHSADPYSAVYTLAELGVTDVSEIAKRTGLGQTEVEMVLNLWRRH